MREHHMTCMGNPTPGKKELFMLADRMNIRKADAEDIVLGIERAVSELLGEWL